MRFISSCCLKQLNDSSTWELFKTSLIKMVHMNVTSHPHLHFLMSYFPFPIFHFTFYTFFIHQFCNFYLKLAFVSRCCSMIVVWCKRIKQFFCFLFQNSSDFVYSALSFYYFLGLGSFFWFLYVYTRNHEKERERERV